MDQVQQVVIVRQFHHTYFFFRPEIAKLRISVSIFTRSVNEPASSPNFEKLLIFIVNIHNNRKVKLRFVDRYFIW